ncbi:transforming growth factor beta-1-induced transcript 1 protein isoform X7 [Penaeus vannamei]|uniref:transforming growth factor beta-1-induced transcript 1 protein isoform X7 n=1 Tax=Penaeus vannamei TaxID=6689 RepID=UPI00387F59A0
MGALHSRRKKYEIFDIERNQRLTEKSSRRRSRAAPRPAAGVYRADVAMADVGLASPAGQDPSAKPVPLKYPFEQYVNALLADLQNTITPATSAPTTPHPAHNGVGTPSPTPSPNSTLSHSQHHPSPHKVYHQERVEEVRTEQRSSGGGKMASLNNNLSELDTLLQDLNNARYTGVFKEPAAATNGTVNGSRPTVDSLLDALDDVDTGSEVVERRTVHHEIRSSTSAQPQAYTAVAGPAPSVRQQEPSASSATKELDDLMASLSDFKKGDDDPLLAQLEEEILQGTAMSKKVKTSVERHTHKAAAVSERQQQVSASANGAPRQEEQARPPSVPPPRPPVPEETDLLAVPPPRPPVPRGYSDTPLPPEAYVFGGTVVTQSVLPRVGGGVFVERRHVVDGPADDPFNRPPSGGPVKRNDAEYRWVTDATKYEYREVVDFPCVSERINASTLQTQVDSAYAKPQKSAKSPSPPAPAPAPLKEPTPPKEPSPTPTPPQPNQLDSMLGSLASHMTEQGITTTQKGCCSACDKPIVGQVITALGKTWHPEHFTCAHCNQELGTKNFFERDGRPYCEVDYHNLFSPRCAYCNGPILDKCVTALDTTWHPEHFFCAQCGNTFGDDGFHEKDGKPYCRDDYFNMFAPKCGGCNAPIMDNYISALNAQWHPECFVCRDCRQPFNGGSFFDHEGMPYCETHYHAKRGSLCAGCHKPITGRCITAMFRKFHPEHFVCSFCLKQLNKGTFKEQNDKPYCHGCFDKLFG